MDQSGVLSDAFDRVRQVVHSVCGDMSESELAERPNGTGNSVAWLVWHLSRIQDDHVAGVAGTEQVWTAERWNDRFDLSLDDEETGYGHTGEDVGKVLASAANLIGYHDAVVARTLAYVDSVGPADLDRVLDEYWDPPVTVGVRLVSVISDCLQHAGQAAYVAGLIR